MSADVAAATSDDATLLAALRGATRTERYALFDPIFHAHRRRVLALCQRLCGTSSLAEDALQETFLDVYRGLPAFRGEAQIGTWIYRIAVRAALRVRAHHKPSGEDSPERAADARAIEPHAALMAREQARTVQAALDALPAEQRVVVALFAVEGLSHAEIADILGIPEGTVWSRLHKGRKALAAAIG